MNVIWGMMLLVGIGYGILTGEAEVVSEAVLSSAKEGVSLCITMFGAMALWSGLMEIAKDAGIVRSLTRRMRPVICFLFPKIPRNHPAIGNIAATFAANMLGLGNAATVYGLEAMKSLEKLEEERREEHASGNRCKEERSEKNASYQSREEERRRKGTWNSQKRAAHSPVPRGTASNEMCSFLILNISSLQLIPITVIAYRGQYGSVNSSAIVAPGIVATAVSTGVAVIFCKLMDHGKRPSFRSARRDGKHTPA
ncbi:MAG: nucleoside recognition protein [Lachnospiraceae bacterium]|nr:nucleoside recognition protein [Lachnospiraceae bacterium]